MLKERSPAFYQFRFGLHVTKGPSSGPDCCGFGWRCDGRPLCNYFDRQRFPAWTNGGLRSSARTGTWAGPRRRRLWTNGEPGPEVPGGSLAKVPVPGTTAWRPSPAEPDGTFLMTFYREFRGMGLNGRINGVLSATHDEASRQLPTFPWMSGAWQMAVVV